MYSSSLGKHLLDWYLRICLRLWDTVALDADGVEATFSLSTKEEARYLLPTATEEDILSDVIKSIDEDDVFYDVGANVGYYTCFISKVVGSKNVVAFEPHPDNIAKLELNSELNGVNPEVLQYALTDEEGIMTLSDHGGSGTNQSLLWNDGSLEVETVPGDKLVESGEIPPPTVLKIDVEGAERMVLEGLSDSLVSERCRLIYCEVHPGVLTVSEDELHDYLRSLGYEIEWITPREDRWGIYTIRAEK